MNREMKCPNCKGTGKLKTLNLADLTDKNISNLMKTGGMNCPRCNGTGILPGEQSQTRTEPRQQSVEAKTCRLCGRTHQSEDEVCPTCSRKTIVHSLTGECDISDLEPGKLYEGMVESLQNFGAFISLNSQIKGLAHTRNFKTTPRVGDTIFVEVKSIQANGNIDLIPRQIQEYTILPVEKDIPRTQISRLGENLGKLVRIQGEVIQTKQTAGPTIFTISDETGAVPCAAFEKAGIRAYPEINQGMIVRIIGEVNSRDKAIQIEVRSLRPLYGVQATEIKKEIEKAIEKRSQPHKTKFLIESPLLEALRAQMEQVAREIKKAILTSRPLIIRHHADADGITSAVAIERAVLPLIQEIGGPDAEYYYYKRAPSKAPFYELEDITRDLTYALEDQSRHGQKLPLILLLDNGSTEEDIPAMKQAQVYGIPILVVDHHHPDQTVDPYLQGHVNPAHKGGDYGITTGMLAVEIARMINPNVTEEIKHFPAISATGDRSEAPEAALYKKLIEDKYTQEELEEIALALDYEAFYQRFHDGRGIINDILNLGLLDRHRKITRLLASQAREAIKNQLETSLPNVKTQTLPNKAQLNVIDLENYAHKFTFPPPGKTCGEIHDHHCKKLGKDKPIVTLGYGPDFAILRSQAVKMNIPQMVRELREEIPGAGVNGGGHLVVGSIKFVEGKRKQVLARLAQKIGETPIE